MYKLSSVWSLETPMEGDYAYFLSNWIEETIESQDEQAIASIRKLWDGESWNSIVKKSRVEGSTWYCWWMYGVRAYLQMEAESIINGD